MVGARKNDAHVLDQNRAIAATQPIGSMLAPAADIGRRSWPMSTLPQLERVGHDRVHFVAVAQRTARIRHDEIAFAQPFADLDIHVRMKTDLHHPRLDDVVAHDLDPRPLGPVVHRGAGSRNSAASISVDCGASKHSQPQPRIPLQRKTRSAKLRALIDSSRCLANAALEFPAVFDLDARGLSGRDCSCVYARNFGLELNFVVDRDPE